MNSERFANPPDSEIRRILQTPCTIALIGCSDNPDRDSLRIAVLLASKSFRVIPVNPTLHPEALQKWLGEDVYPDLESIPDTVEMVDVFRQPRYLPEIVDQAIAKRVRVLWCQLGVVDDAQALRAQAAGLTVVMDRCPAIEYRRLF